MKRRHPQDGSHPRRRSRRVRAQTVAPLLDYLQPVLPLFHSLLTKADAVRLLRTSRTSASALLSLYSATNHTFQPASLASLRLLRDLCLTHGLRVKQLALPGDVQEMSFDSTPPYLSPIPASVTVISLSQPLICKGRQPPPSWAAFSAAAADWQDRQPWRLPVLNGSSQSDEAAVRACVEFKDVLPTFPDAGGVFRCPLTPGLLPDGLRLLRLSDAVTQPLQVGALPSSLSFLHLGSQLDLPLPPGALPEGLLYLSLRGNRRTLLPGSLPRSLERLRLDCTLAALQLGVLLHRVKVLHLERVEEPLQPHALPTSLLYLSLGTDFQQQLQVGALPEGLQCLRFSSSRKTSVKLPPLLVGVLPSTLLAIDLADRHTHPLPVGVIPTSVRWLQLSSTYRKEGIEAVLPPHAEVVWY